MMLPGPDEISTGWMWVVRVVVTVVWIGLSVGYVMLFRVQKK